MTDKIIDILETCAGFAISAGFIFLAAYTIVGGIWWTDDKKRIFEGACCALVLITAATALILFFAKCTRWFCTTYGHSGKYCALYATDTHTHTHTHTH